MYPTYRWADSYPHQVNSMHYAPSDDPRAKGIPSHMMVDPRCLNSPYKPWSYDGNYCCPVPPECHGCCNHNYFGGPYSFRHPYHHYPPPPPPCHTHGVYPPFPGTYPAYTLPPPHYSVEQPRYDFDKNTHTPHHCRGCNRMEDDKRLRIEREEREIDKRPSDSLVPSHLKNYPYPVMWIPPGYMHNTEPEVKEREKYSNDHVPLKPLEPSKRGGNGEAAQDRQAGDGYNLPFPIFWLPLKNNEVEKGTKGNNLDQVTCNAGNDDQKKQPRENEDDLCSEADSEMMNKHAVQKVIPVKQMEMEQEEKSPEVMVTKEKLDTVEKTDNSADKKPSSKTSKLPPVCLRIDPLPRRKNGSRSPSPPTNKGRSKESPTETTKSSQQQTPLEGLKNSNKEQSESNIKTIEGTDNGRKAQSQRSPSTPTDEGRSTELPTETTKSSQQQTQSIEGLKKSNKEQSESNIKTIKVTDNVNMAQSQSLVDSCENSVRNFEAEDCGEKGNKMEKKKLSEHEAALIIQSAYRGLEVRMSQPLKKLRQISEVQKQVAELRNRILDLESSSSNVHVDDKQKLIIGESIMSLLLKLDTIQGLHPVVRDIRKSVARELVGLQEKLDSLSFVKPGTSSMETTTCLKPNDVPIRNPSSEDGAIHEKPGQTQTHSGSNVETVKFGGGALEHHKVEATECQEDGRTGACEANHEPQVQLEGEQGTGDVRLQMVVENEQQPVDDATQEKSDQGQAEFDSEVERLESVPRISENLQVGAAESQTEAWLELESQQMNGELSENQLQIQEETEQPQPVDDAIQEKSDQAHGEFDSKVETLDSVPGISKNLQVGAAESQTDGGIHAHEARLELERQQMTGEFSKNQLQIQVETEQPQPVDSVIQEKSDQAQDQSESNVNKESEDHGGVETDDMKSQQSTRELNDNYLHQMMVESEQCVEVGKDVGAEDAAGDKECEEPRKAPMEDVLLRGNNDGDRNLIEENKRLKEAMEEQVSVITELAGRVKDLEKKLWRKKKTKTRKGRGRGAVVEEEWRRCMV